MRRARSADRALAAIDREAYRHRLDVFFASRDSAEALAAAALDAGPGSAALARAAADVARYVDEAIAIVQEEYKPRLDCGDRCAFCCCKPGVLVSRPELARVVEHIRTAFTPGEIAATRDRAQRYMAVLAGHHFNDVTAESIPCPLLAGDRCSAYAVRPLVCRGYNSTNVEACRAAHTDAAATVPVFAILKDAADGATLGITHALRAHGYQDAVVDLGSALYLALQNGDSPAPDIATAESLDAVEDRAWADDLWRQIHDVARQVGIDLAGAPGPV